MSQPKDQWETDALGKDSRDAQKGVTRRNTEYTNYNYRLGTEQDKNQATVQMCKMNKLINYFTSWHKTKKVIVRWSSTPKDLGLK